MTAFLYLIAFLAAVQNHWGTALVLVVVGWYFSDNPKKRTH